MYTSEQLVRYKELIKEGKELQKKVTKSFRMINIVALIIGGIIGFVISILALRTTNNQGAASFTMPYLYFGVLLTSIFYILQIIFHEGGHLVFGLLTGYKFLSFRIYSTIFYKHNGKIKRKKYSMKGTGGQCLMYPPKRKEDGSFPFVLYNMGGGISNLFFSFLVLILALIIENTGLRIYCLIFFGIGVLLAVTNLVPLNIGIQNDGMNMKQMLKSKEMQDAFYTQLNVNAQMSDGKLITEYSPSDFPLIEGEDSTNMLAAFNYFYCYYLYLANHDYDKAREILNQMSANSEKYLPASLNFIEIERLFFMVIDKKPVEEIAAVYKYVRVFFNIPNASIGIQRVRYVFENMLSESDKKDIMAFIIKKEPKKWKVVDEEKSYNDFIKRVKNYPVSGEATMHADIVEYLRNNYIINNA